ncbi:DUF7844 domain-containing protein [Xanthomonas sp. 60]
MPRRCAVACAALLLGIAGLAQGSAALAVDEGLSAADAAYARAARDAVMQQLPAGLRSALPAEVHIEWRDDLPPHVAGRTFAGGIRLDRALLDRRAGARLRSTLLHELVHVADRAGGHWSRSARLRELAGWQRRPWRLGRTPNRFEQRSPDAYELHSPAEYLAVNVEHWLQDPSFACRRPALASWLVDTFGPAPIGSLDCSAVLPLLAAGEDEGAVELLQLDPARVYAVDYLFAEGAEAPMSRWGHSMLRLVICREGRAPGPDCRMDLDQHRVLSFRAFVGDVALSNWRGLSGGYPSRLFVLPLQQVVDDYTRVELRSLASLPLRLQPQDIRGLLARAAQVHWSYDGRYYFVGNNCAVETAKLLQAAVPALAEAGIERITPRGLRRRLERRGWLDEHVLDDPATAVREGYYFESADTHYAQLFAVARTELALPARDARRWLAMGAAERAPWLQRGGLRSTAGLLLLEQAAQRRAELRARDTVKHRLLRRPGSEQAHQLQILLTRAGQWLQPGGLLPHGYGVPQSGELATLQPALQALSQEGPAAWKALRTELRAALPAVEQRELDALRDNLQVLDARLRVLAAAPLQ